MSIPTRRPYPSKREQDFTGPELQGWMFDCLERALYYLAVDMPVVASEWTRRAKRLYKEGRRRGGSTFWTKEENGKYQSKLRECTELRDKPRPPKQYTMDEMIELAKVIGAAAPKLTDEQRRRMTL